jgi:eukaryotic-like serine/threonine-protein kinase
VTADRDPTRTLDPGPPTDAFDPALAVAFGPDLTPGGWSQPPLLRDEPSDHAPFVQPSSREMPRASPDRYQLLGEIARGGMGVVLKGRDPDLGRDLAFKVLRAELAGQPAAVQRFVEEAQVGGQLQHPGVVPVYDLGRFADGRPYFAMKLVKGRTLADLLAERPDSPSDRGKFLQVFLQVCQTIAYAHAKGVIHRDLKPSNVMVGAFGEVLVMDWGLAKVLPRGGVADEIKASQVSQRPKAEEPTVIHTARVGSIGSETQAGSVMGTPAFMSPEQAAGEIDKLDERADVFSLGAVLCVVLAGQPPYVADTSEAVRLMAVRGQLADAFARLDACGTDAELADVCKRCLSPDRDARSRHAGEVAGALLTYLAGVESRAHRAEVERALAEAKAAEERKRRKVQLALAASLFGLAILGGGGAWWAHDQRVKRDTELARQHDETERLVTAALDDEPGAGSRALDRRGRGGRPGRGPARRRGVIPQTAVGSPAGPSRPGDGPGLGAGTVRNI